jgi:gas vesicle protein
MMAFLMGAAAGGLAALLLAPRSGEETRRRLKESADEIYEKGEEKVKSATSQVLDRASDVGETVKEHVDDATSATRSRVEAVKEAADEAKHAYQKELRRQESRG